MTWIDVLLIGFILVCVGAGAFMGSLWSGACMAAGFLGAFLADMMTSSVVGFTSSFFQNELLIKSALFSLGCIVVLIPGWIISKTVTVLFFGLFDRAAGLVVGAGAGLLAVSIVLLGLVPLVPQIEKSSSWKKSSLVRPMQKTLETVFSNKRLQLREVAIDFVDDLKKAP